MRELYHPKRSEIELTAVMHALSDPTRLSIVRSLADGQEQACGTFAVDVAKSTLSQHFKVLRDAGLVRTRLEGTLRMQTLRRDDLDARFPGLLDAVVGPSPSKAVRRDVQPAVPSA
jgi:DNA-binding transcriptional ArsR family regulator